MMATCAALAAGALGASCALVAISFPTSMLPTASAASTTLNGIDVSSAQHLSGTINWSDVAAAGYEFAAIKGTEGNYYINPYYATDAADAVAAGLYVSAYEFANPAESTGTVAAQYTAQNAGNYTVGGNYLPLMLDLEADPYTATDGLNECYGLTPAQMVTWISDFMTEAATLTGAAPFIYVSPDWWESCTGNSTAFSSDLLWIASYSASAPSPLPGGWSNWSFWQYTDSGSVPGINGDVDLDYFNGSLATLNTLANQDVSTRAAVAWTGTAEVTAAVDSSGNLDYWWQAAGTAPWHEQQVAAAGSGLTYQNPAITWTGTAEVITATDSSGNLDYWWQAAGTAPWNQQQVAAAGSGVTYASPSIAWTGTAEVITALVSSGGLDYWWQAVGTAPWHQEFIG
jgi:GH25 family lysozyme M1 (1,4-beta-N-acetylmuramidase)